MTGSALRERVARALTRNWRENGGQSDEAFISRAVDHAWRDYLPATDAALSTLTLADHIAAVETGGEWAVVPVEPTLGMCAQAMRHRDKADLDHYDMAFIYRAMIAKRPRDAG